MFDVQEAAREIAQASKAPNECHRYADAQDAIAARAKETQP